MNRRRTRHTLTFEDGHKEVVLGYSANDLIPWAERTFSHGKVRKVMKGDYRKAVAKRKAFQEGGFTIDRAQLAKATHDILKLEFPISISYSNHFAHVSGEDGHHKLVKTPSGLRHEIVLKSYLKPSRASHVLWHELTHARQAEAAGKAMRGEGLDKINACYTGWRLERTRQWQTPYSRRPIELEAEKVANEMKDVVLCF